MTERVELEIQLMAISPVSYLLAKEGDLLQIKRTVPRKGEYRSRIGGALEAFLVFKGVTKIGMIPRNIVANIGAGSIGRTCRICRMERDKNIITIKLTPVVASDAKRQEDQH